MPIRNSIKLSIGLLTLAGCMSATARAQSSDRQFELRTPVRVRSLRVPETKRETGSFSESDPITPRALDIGTRQWSPHLSSSINSDAGSRRSLRSGLAVGSISGAAIGVVAGFLAPLGDRTTSNGKFSSSRGAVVLSCGAVGMLLGGAVGALIGSF